VHGSAGCLPSCVGAAMTHLFCDHCSTKADIQYQANAAVDETTLPDCPCRRPEDSYTNVRTSTECNYDQ